MSPKLSPYAVHRIIYFLKNDDRRCRAVKKTSAAPTMQYVRKVDMSWKCIYTHYFLQNPPPPMDYLRSLELMLIVKKDLDSEDMQAVFRHGKPMVFDADIPRLLVPKTVEAFQQLKEEPPFLDVTLCSSAGTWTSDLDILAVWPQAYIDYVPSAAWTTAEERGRANQGKPQNVKRSRDDSGTHVASSLVDAQAARFVVEEFHIPSKHFGKELTVELHFTLDNRPRYAARIRPSTASNLVKNELRNVTLRLCDLPCSGSRSETVRRSKTPLLLADFAFEVYGFLDRAHVGTSLLANSALNELIFKLRNRLPVHHLTCEFEPRIVMSSVNAH